MSTNDPYSTPQGGQQPYGQQQPYGAQSQYGAPQYGAPQNYGQPPQGSYGQQPHYGGPQQFGAQLPPLAHWGQRVGAYLIDGLVLLPAYLLVIPGYVQLISSSTSKTQCFDTTNPDSCYAVHESGSISPALVLLMLLGFVAMIALQIWNRWIKGGRGQSIGKRVLGITLIDERTGRPIGTGMAFVRDLAHFLDGVACYIGYLWPLWDAKRQTFSDKVMNTVVIQGTLPGDKR